VKTKKRTRRVVGCSMSDTDESSLDCAICMEVLSVDQLIQLPCRCQVTYCLGCWDRALAQAFNDSGHARCPTCRSPVHVAFDPDAGGGRGQLVFSNDDEAETREEVVNRLADQAAPLMARYLRQFGESSSLRDMAQDPTATLSAQSVQRLRTILSSLGGDATNCVEKSDFVEEIIQLAGSAARVAMVVCMEGGIGGSEEAGDGPRLRCVCGGKLERVDGRTRCRQLFAGTYPMMIEEQMERFLDAFMALPAERAPSCVVCDLCDKRLQPSSPVFTCGNGERTILHPTTYDVCEDCFVHFAVDGSGDELLATERDISGAGVAD
jgi:hypothetical protein